MIILDTWPMRWYGHCSLQFPLHQSSCGMTWQPDAGRGALVLQATRPGPCDSSNLDSSWISPVSEIFDRPPSGVHSATVNGDVCDTSHNRPCHALAMYASASVSSSGRPKGWAYYSWGAWGDVGAAVWADSFVSMAGEVTVTRWKLEGRYSEACRS